MKRKGIAVILIMALLFAFTGCGDSANNSDAQKDGEVYKVALARNLPESDPTSQGDLYLKKLLEEKSDGRFEVTWYGNSQVVANDTEALEKVADGTIQITSTTAATLASYASMPVFNVFNEPMMFTSEEELWTLAESDYMKNYYKEFQEKTGVILSENGFSMGWYGYGTAKKDITEIEKIKGMKIRVANVPQMIGLTEALGAAPTSINWNEIFTTLQQGAVDGILCTGGLTYNNSFYEVLKYFKNAKAFACYHAFIVNEKWYSSLPEDLQQIFDECIAEATETYRANLKESEDGAVQAMSDSGVNCSELTENEKAELEKMALEIWKNEDKAAVSNEVVNEVLDIIGKSNLKF